jgi:hypothetical protein
MLDKELVIKMIGDYEAVIKTVSGKLEELKKIAKENNIEVEIPTSTIEQEAVVVVGKEMERIEEKKKNVLANLQKMREESMEKIKRLVDDAKSQAQESVRLANSASLQSATAGSFPNLEEMKAALSEKVRKKEGRE